ncbi:type VI secretion system baseplate subunit TssG [Vitiosangium sp. GDMCC 1.1324]|uniref:type VI secretion system baseplate subunit TssG n=1 Tax=Vitiosangium sp. (strain GDMCC 1.1324) TaxID=2138576 RepID=UPI000D37543D|nr:type VI secretion system baseplate subunit TssG [Vitiosangium sp. GDMCC 1.1324]PTL80734.1 hypothetical protein DAT35_25615 [Vitiosangium sp. GDMCC 1.1324]
MGATTTELTPTEERIVARAREFELGPLLRLLEAEGYPPGHILFESNPEPVSPAAFVEAVTFHRSPLRRVVVTLNLGLLGANALLPSYFLEVAEQCPQPESFFDFIRFFDHRLLEGFARALYPEHDSALVGDWERTKGFYFRMLGVGSVTTLQWFFQLYFPELRVWVSRSAFRDITRGHEVRTGTSPLDGTAVLGDSYTSESAGFQVELHAEEETDARGRGWPEVVEHRLHEILLPLLAPARVRLEVGLTVAAHAVWARLAQRGYLGYERLHGGTLLGHRVVIFLGNTAEPPRPRAAPSPGGRRDAA